jgi:type I restriction enzyme R subunit
MPPKELERQTRRQRIDPRLKAADWKVTRFDPGMPLSAYDKAAVEEFDTANGPADYAVCNDGRALGVVEAKKVTLGPQGVLVQAERYSKGVDQVPKYQGEFGAPFLYSTNGEQVWFHDVRNPLNRSRRVAGFHTPTALDELLTRDFDSELEALAAAPQHYAILAKAFRGELLPAGPAVSAEAKLSNG